jgi:hypothetical protein
LTELVRTENPKAVDSEFRCVDGIGRDTGQALLKHLSGGLRQHVNPSQRLDLMLLALGEKPGALVIGVEAGAVPVLEEFCHDLDLHSAVDYGQNRSLVDRVLRRDTRFLKECFFAARHRERLSLLDPNGDFCGTTDRATGEFLGYPDRAVDLYADSETAPAQEASQKAEKMLETGAVDQADLRRTRTVSYVPCPETQSILDCVETAKRRTRAIEAFDERFDTEVGERLMDSAKPMLGAER